MLRVDCDAGHGIGFEDRILERVLALRIRRGVLIALLEKRDVPVIGMKPAKIACNEIKIHHHIIAAPHAHRNAGDLRPGYLQPGRGHCHDQRLHLRAVCRSIIGDDLCRELVFQILCQLALEELQDPGEAIVVRRVARKRRKGGIGHGV